MIERTDLPDADLFFRDAVAETNIITVGTDFFRLPEIVISAGQNRIYHTAWSTHRITAFRLQPGKEMFFQKLEIVFDRKLLHRFETGPAELFPQGGIFDEF